MALQAPPLLPLLVVDYSFDRFTDIILTTRDGYYGFTQVRPDRHKQRTPVEAVFAVHETAVVVDSAFHCIVMVPSVST
jgi:hypothetical protein